MDTREMVGGGGMGCEYCDDTGEVEMDNNGPIGPCPMCRPPASLTPDERRTFGRAFRGPYGSLFLPQAVSSVSVYQISCLTQANSLIVWSDDF